MDFQGQKNWELACWGPLVLLGMVAFILGFLSSDFQLMARFYGTGCLFLAILLIPDHPYYPPSWVFNRHPAKWLPALNPSGSKVNPSIWTKIARLLGLAPAAPPPAEQASTVKKAKTKSG